MNSITYFVPVDFTRSAYHAVEYAMMMARISGGQISLFHNIDLQLIEESDNPVVVNLSIDRLFQQAESRMKSLREMIREVNIRASYSIELGYSVEETVKLITTQDVDFVVVGKCEQSTPRVQQTIQQLSIPVFVIPETAPLQMPASFLLATDLKHVAADGFMHFLELVKSSEHPLQILHITREGRTEGYETILRAWADELKGFVDVDTQLRFAHHHNVTEGILDYCKQNQVDLLCAISRKRLIPRFFGPSVSDSIVRDASVPVLVLSARTVFR